MERAASLAQQALDAGVTAKSKFVVTPGSEQIRATIARDGQMEVFEKIGGVVLGMSYLAHISNNVKPY